MLCAVNLVLPVQQVEVFLDLVDQSSAEFLAPVHRQNAHQLATSDEKMSTVAWLEGAPVYREPALELIARHVGTIQHFYSIYNRYVLKQTSMFIGT
jgi:hypothetical protein